MKRIAFALLILLAPPSAWAACTGPAGTAGQTIYSNTYHQPQYCNGTSWVGFSNISTGGGPGCTGPTGKEGVIVYNADYSVLQYCNGTSWIAVGSYCGAATTPVTIFGTSLVAWYDASDYSSIVLSGSAVTQWNDKSGNGYNLVPPDAGSRPTYSATGSPNGKATLSFSGAQLLLLNSDVVALGGTMAGAFIVVSVNSGGVSGERIMSFRGAGQAQDYDNAASTVFMSRNGSTLGFIGYRNGTGSQATLSAYATVSRLGSIWDGTNHIMYLNNSPSSSVAQSGTFGSTGRFFVGDAPSRDGQLTGTISEIVIVKGTITSTQRSNLDSYLAGKW